MDEKWQVNISPRTKRIKLKNLLYISNNIKNTIIINKDYLTHKYSSLLENIFKFVNFEDNNHYLNFSESEYDFIVQNNTDKEFNLDNFTKITFNEDINNSKIILNKLTLKKWIIVTSFRIHNSNNKKVLNCFIYYYYDEKNDKMLYTILTYYEIKNIFLTILTSYIEVLLYIYKIECDMGKTPYLSKIINKYPYEFNDLNRNEIRSYFNNLPKVWINN